MTIPDDKLERSYRYCRRVSRTRAKNFYYSFLVLPKEKRDAISAVYAFMRYCDDLADDPDVRADRKLMLTRWRESLDKAAQGDYGDDPILPAFHDAMTRFSIPLQYFHELIDGAVADLTVRRYGTFDELYGYCYKVASVVGLVCIHIFGFDTPEAKKYAEYGGIAFQLTNILRDVHEDARSGRVYIPQEDLRAFGYTVEDLANGVRDDRFRRLMQFEVARAKSYYAAALPLVPLVHGSGRPGLCAMIEIYYKVLKRIERSEYDVFDNRISLSKREKVTIAARSLLRCKINGGRPYLPQLPS